MIETVDLTARTGGLVSVWLVPVVAVIWILAIWLIHRNPPQWKRDSSGGLAAIGALVLANVLFFWRPLFTDAHIPIGGGDLNSFFFTLHAYSAERVTSGELPLWNPDLHGGMPHLGNFQAGVLYPPNLIAWVISTPFTYGTLELLAILHYLIASIGLYLLLRSLGAERIGAVAGGIVFAYAGFMVAHLGHYSMISVAAWVPWMLWAVHELVRRPGWLRTAVLALLVFLSATGGHQQTLLFGLVGAGVWWIFLVLYESGMRVPGIGDHSSRATMGETIRGVLTRFNLLRAIQFVTGTMVGVALAMPMILPSLQVARWSVRSSLSYEKASEFSVQPIALLQLVLPTVFGSNPTDHWGAFSSGEIWGYAGVIALILTATAIILRATPVRVFFGVVALTALIYAVGPYTPLHGWIYQFMPPFDLVRAPARAYLFLNLATAVLAGLAITDLSGAGRHVGDYTRALLGRILRTTLLAIGAVAIVVLPLFYSRILGADDPPNRPVIVVDNLHMLVLFLSVFALIIWLARRRQLRGAMLGVLLTGLITLELFSATAPFNPVGEDLVASYREPEASTFLAERGAADDPFRIEVRHPGLLPNFGSVNGLHTAAGVFDPLQPAAYTALHDALALSPELPAYNMLNVRYWLTDAETSAPPGFERAHQTEAGTVIWERPSALPRAWFVSNAIEARRVEAHGIIQDPAFDPESTVVVVGAAVEPDGDAAGTVELLRYQPESIELSVDVDGEGYLVLADGDYPGWRAELDGESVEILTANAGLRAVPVDSGAERVTFSYQPALVTYSWAIAGLGAAGIVLMLFLGITGWRVPFIESTRFAKSVTAD